MTVSEQVMAMGNVFRKSENEADTRRAASTTAKGLFVLPKKKPTLSSISSTISKLLLVPKEKGDYKEPDQVSIENKKDNGQASDCDY